MNDDRKSRDCTVCFSDVLLRWYDCDARTLPWRMHSSAQELSESDRVYRVWLSEVMLQQTQVGTVVPFYKAKERIQAEKSTDCGLLFYPQTSGGILATVPLESLNGALAELARANEQVHSIGRIVEGPPVIALV